MNVNKESYQIFTPKRIVTDMLNKVGYKSEEIINKKVLENSCGDGNFLVEIVERYIVESKKVSKTNEEIKLGLETNIFGVEIDPKLVEKCENNIKTIAMNHGIHNVKWNLFNQDSLISCWVDGFDFIIGNPPYIKYHNLDNATRNYIREVFHVCQIGKPDYYFSFIEHSLLSLRENGKLCYLVPNNFFKNSYARNLRKFILPELVDVEDYTTLKLFDSKLTSSAIITCKKSSVDQTFIYNDVVNMKSDVILKDDLVDKWIFAKQDYSSGKSSRFGDYYSVSHGVATLLNDAFVLKDFEVQGKLISTDNWFVEVDSTRIAVSPRSLSLGKEERIIFPYEYENASVKKIETEDFKSRFPQAYIYLESNRKELEKRKSDMSASWIHFGRSQALSHLMQRKLVMSTIITNNVSAFIVDSETIPYSGLYITSKDQFGIEVAKKVLESEDFMSFVASYGINSNGSSFRISSKDILEFRFNLTEFI